MKSGKKIEYKNHSGRHPGHSHQYHYSQYKDKETIRKVELDNNQVKTIINIMKTQQRQIYMIFLIYPEISDEEMQPSAPAGK